MEDSDLSDNALHDDMLCPPKPVDFTSSWFMKFNCGSRACVETSEWPKLLTADELKSRDTSVLPLYNIKGWIRDGSAFWGTSWLLAETQCHFSSRLKKWRPLFLVAFALLVILILLLLCFMAITSEGKNPTIVGCFQKAWNNADSLNRGCGVNAQYCRPLESLWETWRCQSNCLGNWNGPVYGSGEYYAGIGRICASAIHAGAIQNGAGGCFRMRYAGPKKSFLGNVSNGVESQSYGWFPLSLEFESIPGQNCYTVYSFVDFYVIMMALILCLFIRPSAWYVYVLVSIAGPLWAFFSFAESTKYNTQFLVILNDVSPQLFICFLIAIILWPISMEHTMPSPRNFPIDTFIFFFLPFWLGIRFEILSISGVIDLSLDSSIFSSSAYIVGFVILLVVFIPGAIMQFAIYYVTGRLWKFLSIAASVFVVVLIIALIAADYLSLHLHHWIAGIIGVAFFQGQSRSRFSICLSAFSLGIALNGIAIYELDPLFDQVVTGSSSGGSNSHPDYLWTGLNVSGTVVYLEWAHKSTVMNVFNCSLDKFSQEDTSNSTLERRLTASESSYGFLPKDNLALFQMKMSGILLFSEFFPQGLDVYNYSFDTKLSNTSLIFLVGNGGRTTENLLVETFENTNYTEDICERVKQLNYPLLS